MNTIDTIKRLHSETGIGVMECKKVLEKNGQNFELALAGLNQSTAQKASKHADREALAGRLELYSHNSGRIGVMVEINIETEFASRSEIFLGFVCDIALQITAMSPLYVRDEDIPQNVLAEIASDASAKARQDGKSEKIIAKIVEGVLEKYKNKFVLLRQLYLRDETLTIAQVLDQKIGQLGENIIIRRFVRWELNPDAE